MSDLTNRYAYSVRWSEEDGEYVGTCLEFRSVSGFGDTPEEALDDVLSVVKASVALLNETGRRVPEPLSLRSYKGVLSLRIPPDTHKQVALAAAAQSISVNQYITSAIEKSLGWTVGERANREILRALDELIGMVEETSPSNKQFDFSDWVFVSGFEPNQNALDYPCSGRHLKLVTPAGEGIEVGA